MTKLDTKQEIINSAELKEEVAKVANPEENNLSLLRFITCGSVDDGKSTLIGRMLFDAGQVYDDQIEALDDASKKFGTQGAERDYALLVDGLSAEREQGITIDVAYRYFRTKKRAFIVADTPGHEQYTRNMATGASNAELAIILIDARKGVLPQTRRHALIVSLLGVKKVVLAINKMDLKDYSQEVFEKIHNDFLSHSSAFDFEEVVAIPLAAKNGENILLPSDNMSWYKGQTLLNYLENVEIKPNNDETFHFVVQWVNRPNLDFRGFSGYVASGSVKPGDKIRVSSSGQTSTVAKIVTQDGDLTEAVTGQSVTITLNDEIDISRGDILSAAISNLKTHNQFASKVLWMSAQPLRLEKEYILKHGAQEVPARVTLLENGVDFNTLETKEIEVLNMNGVGKVVIHTNKPILVQSYKKNRELGAFILIDRISNETVALGFVDTFELKPEEKQEGLVAMVARFLPNVQDPKKIADYAKSWFPFSALATFFVVLLVTMNMKWAFLLSCLELVLKPVIQALHYRAYNKGKNPDYSDESNIDGSGI